MKIKIPFFKRNSSQEESLVATISQMIELEEILYNRLMDRENIEKLTEIYSVA